MGGRLYKTINVIKSLEVIDPKNITLFFHR